MPVNADLLQQTLDMGALCSQQDSHWTWFDHLFIKPGSALNRGLRPHPYIAIILLAGICA